MANRVIQAQVVDPSSADFDSDKRFWKLALFNPDGTPYVASAGGVSSDPAAITDLRNRVTTLEEATPPAPTDISGLEDRIAALEAAPAGGGGGADLSNLDPNTRIQWRDQTTGDILAEVYLEHPPEGQYLYAVAYKTDGVENQVRLIGADNFVDTLARAFDGDTNGLFYWLGTNRGAQAWANPAGAGGPVVVSVSSSNPYDFNGPWVVPSEVTGRNGRGAHEEWASTQTPGQWIKWDLGAAHRMEVSQYALQRYADFSPTQQVAHWKLQGSNNNVDWTDLDSQDVAAQDAADAWRTFALATPVPGAGVGWRYLRLLSTGPNTGGADQFVLSEIEFYGALRSIAA
jgi:hypothetical protein